MNHTGQTDKYAAPYKANIINRIQFLNRLRTQVTADNAMFMSNAWSTNDLKALFRDMRGNMIVSPFDDRAMEMFTRTIKAIENSSWTDFLGLDCPEPVVYFDVKASGGDESDLALVAYAYDVKYITKPMNRSGFYDRVSLDLSKIWHDEMQFNQFFAELASYGYGSTKRTMTTRDMSDFSL